MISEQTVYAHDDKGIRTDIHRPSVINPGDYEYLSVYRNAKDPVTGGPAGTCHHCGKWIVWEVHFKHVPSGRVVTFGYICAGILEMTDNRIDHEMNLLKRGAANEKKRVMAEREKEERTRSFAASQPELYAFLTGDEIDLPEYDDYFIKQMKYALERWGWLTDRQADALKKAIARKAEWLRRKTEERIALEDAPVLEAGKADIVGRIASSKLESNPFADGMVRKMLVVLDNGNKVYGTMPRSIEDAVDEYNDVRVSFSATIKPKEDHFGYFSRPTKGKVI